MMGMRDDPGDRRTGVEETTIGSENRSGKRVGGVVGLVGGQDKICGVWVVRSNVESSDDRE